MAILKFKAGVIVPKVTIIAAAVVNAANDLKIDGEIWVTAGRDGKHVSNSKHYYDQALDIRTKNLDNKTCELFVRVIRRRLGKDYDVILESSGKPNEHLHIEYDPKNQGR
jgi:hypothetical protein